MQLTLITEEFRTFTGVSDGRTTATLPARQTEITIFGLTGRVDSKRNLLYDACQAGR